MSMVNLGRRSIRDASSEQAADSLAHPCGTRLSILYLENALSAIDCGGNLWQRQLLLQKRKRLRKRRKIFCRLRALTTLSFMSGTPNKRRTSTKPLSDSKVSLTQD